jgi:nucleoside-diphosphate-sugar epimerase
MPSGYSGTPLAKKLGIKQGHVVSLLNEPDDFRSLLEDLPDDVDFRPGISSDADIVVAFHTERAAFEATVVEAADAIFPAGAIWVAWPKRASKVPTDMTEDVVREVVLPMKLVDNKVCAINEIWSGLRVVWRKEHRTSKPG